MVIRCAASGGATILLRPASSITSPVPVIWITDSIWGTDIGSAMLDTRTKADFDAR